VWGFIDGTFQGFCRPKKNQEDWYSGHKKAHGLKYQGIVTPDGLVSSLVGPYPGPLNDWSMFRLSKVQSRLRKILAGRRRLYLYGDPAYSRCFGIWAPFKHPAGWRYLPMEEQNFNTRLSRIRIAVEQAFGLTQGLWTYVAFTTQLRSAAQPVAHYYRVAVLLSNCFACLRGNTAAGGRFLCRPPELEDYLLGQG
jgi:hypothetical protein